MSCFFSYTQADLFWAEWIAWQLEESGLPTILQAWDFRAGCNFVREMDCASKQAQRTIAVLSASYVNAAYTHPEWARRTREEVLQNAWIMIEAPGARRITRSRKSGLC